MQSNHIRLILQKCWEELPYEVPPKYRIFVCISFVNETWQRMKDSNPHKQSQSLVCYHYTNPLYICLSQKLLFIIPERRILSRLFCKASEKNFDPGDNSLRDRFVSCFKRKMRGHQ